MDAEMEHGESPDGGLKRACDQCRLRKIRCNKESPCSNCTTSNRACSSSGLGQKPKEPRQRVLISTQYERKIDKFEARLAGIESVLRDLTLSIQRGTGSENAFASRSPASETLKNLSPIGDTEVDIADDEHDEPDPAFEGDSSMAAQTAFASEFLEKAVTRTSLRELSPDMETALSSLQQIVNMQNRKGTRETNRFPHAKPLPRGGLRELPMPPTQHVVSILREIKESPPVTFTLICTFIAVDDFTECCRKVFFATEDFSLSTFIVVNAGLFYLFHEKSLQAEEPRKSELFRDHLLCRDNIETALMNLPLLMPARMDTIEALLLGACYAVEFSKFTFAWQLNSNAVLMCQALGYHRLPVDDSESSAINDKKSALFWFSYMMDKGLSLRFGRSSLIQDYDVTMPRRLGRQLNISDFWKEMLNLWIWHAEATGKVYEQLYSPTALTKPIEERVECALRLIDTIKGIARENDELIRLAKKRNSLPADHPGMPGYTMDLMLKSDEVTYWGALALVYRAIPATPGLGSTFNPECIHAAQKAMEVHLECMAMAGDDKYTTAGYLHWTILFVPFIPFIVLFCHTIETSDPRCLELINQFVVTLEPVCPMSEAIEKLYRVCQLLLNVARLYLEAKAQQDQNQDMNLAGNDFEMYLGQLGFMPQQQDPSVATNGAAAAFGGGDGMAAVMGGFDQNLATAQLGNWFSGNRHIMGLVEEDLSGFQPGVWSSHIGP